MTEIVNVYKKLSGPTEVKDDDTYPDGWVVTFLAESNGNYGEIEYWFDSLEALEKTTHYLDEYVKPFQVFTGTNKRMI